MNNIISEDGTFVRLASIGYFIFTLKNASYVCRITNRVYPATNRVYPAPNRVYSATNRVYPAPNRVYPAPKNLREVGECITS